MADVSLRDLADWTGFDIEKIRAKLRGMQTMQGPRNAKLYDSVRALGLIYGSDPDEDGLDLTAERARLAKHQANITEMQEAELRRELVRVGEVEAYWSQIFNNVKAQLIGLPRRIGHLVLGVANLGEVEGVILTEIETTLHELADFVPVPDHQDSAASEATAAADDEPVGGSVPKAVKRNKRRAGKVADEPGAVPKRVNGRRGRPRN